MSAQERTHLWRNATALSEKLWAEGEPLALSERARRYLQRQAPPITQAAVADAPDWLHWARERRLRLARLTGVAAHAHYLRLTLDGATLRSALATVGELALEIILRLPEPSTPAVAVQSEMRAPETFEAAGAATLLTADVPDSGLRSRISPLFPDVSPRLLSPDAARILVETARNILFQLEVVN